MKRSVLWLGILLLSHLGTAQWMQTNGPLGGGNISALFVLGDTVLAGTLESGVFISTNSGVTWDQVDYDFSTRGPRLFILAGDYILAGTDVGIYRSPDGGFTWEDANIGMPSYRPVVAMAFTGTQVIAATGRGSYFVSADNGGTWEGVSLAQPVPAALAVIGDFTFAGSSTGILRSPDNGITWTAVNNGLTDLSVQALAVIGSTLIAGTYQGSLFTSPDNGLSWTRVKSGLADVTALTVSGTILYVLSGGRLFRSVDYGSTLTSINSGLPGTPPVISLAADGLDLFAGLDGGGVYYSAYGGNSWKATSGLPCTTVNALARSGSNIFAGTIGHGLFKSADNGNEWTWCGNGIPGWVGIEALAAKGANVYAGTSGGLYKSVDEGESWTESLAGYQIQAFATSEQAILAGAYWGGVFRSTNDGLTWTQLSNGLPGRPVSALAINGPTLLAGTEGNGVYRSTDNGASWIPVNSGLTDQIVTSLAVIGTAVLAGTYNGLFITTNNGTLWTQLDYGQITTLTTQGSLLIKGTYSGASMSSDTGKTWTPPDESFHLSVNALTSSGSSVFAGTSGGGVYVNPTLITGVEDVASDMPDLLLYPNPAGSAITIEMPAGIACRTLSIYDMNGQEVLRPLITEATSTLDISGLPAGMYVVRYSHDRGSTTGRFIKH